MGALVDKVSPRKNHNAMSAIAQAELDLEVRTHDDTEATWRVWRTTHRTMYALRTSTTLKAGIMVRWLLIHHGESVRVQVKRLNCARGGTSEFDLQRQCRQPNSPKKWEAFPVTTRRFGQRTQSCYREMLQLCDAFNI